MDAFFFTIALFVFFSIVGFGVLTLFPARLTGLQNALIAPSMGIATTILLVFALSRLGLPTQEFGAMAFAGLGVVAVAVIAIRRPSVPRELRFVALILLAALLLAAWPMFFYGFDWVSFGNDDMANYSLGAERFLSGGFFAEPDFDKMFAGKDYAGMFWSMHVVAGVRAGSELMLSAVWGVTGLNAHFIFMPVIFSLHLSLIAATGALMATASASRRAPFITMGLMAISPMSTLGALYQLIGQVGGLTLLCSAVVLTYRPLAATRILPFIVSNIPAVIIFSGIFVWYPELLPFFGLGWLIYVGAMLVKDRAGAVQVILPAAVVGILVIVVMNEYVFEAMSFMLSQVAGGMNAADPADALFPYFLVPSGMPALLGIIPIGNQIGEPWLSIYILMGAAVLAWLVFRILPRRVRQIDPILSVFLAMAVVGLILFFRNNDFGLFKLVMYIQPFLICIFAREFDEWTPKHATFTRRGIVVPLLAVAVAVPVFSTQNGYVSKSTGELYGGLNEIPHASSEKISRQFGEFVKKLPNEDNVGYFADTTNIVLAKFQAFHSQGLSLIFPSRNFFVNILDLTFQDTSIDSLKSYAKFIDAYKNAKDKYLTERQITVGDVTNRFIVPANLSQVLQGSSMITTTENQTIFNGLSKPSSGGYFTLVPKPENKLIFVHSELGNHYYFGLRDRISFYQLENDPMFAGQVFSALGQHLLFMAINPSEGARVRMELSDTVLKQYGSELPKAKAQGTAVGFIGRGSGRVYSPAVTPTQVDGSAYIAIDMDRVPSPIAVPVFGLMNLYGRNVSQDSRRVAAFGRDISLVSDADYQALKPPASLSAFPSDLTNSNLEYSGMYEDGWISERSFFTLAPTEKSKYLVLKGMVPLIGDKDHTSKLRISIDGVQVAEQSLALGDFEIKVPVTDLAGRKRIDLTFDNPQTLPNRDDRKTGGLMNFIGFAEE